MYPIQSVLIYLIMYAIIHYMLWVQKKKSVSLEKTKKVYLATFGIRTISYKSSFQYEYNENKRFLKEIHQIYIL